MNEVKVGQLWVEADNRHRRIVRVLAVDCDIVTIITESDSNNGFGRGILLNRKKYFPTKANIKRFGRHGGYFLLREAD